MANKDVEALIEEPLDVADRFRTVTQPARFRIYAVKDRGPLLTAPVTACLHDDRRWNSERFPVNIRAYVIMPEHVQMLIRSERGDNIVRFSQRVLGHSSKRLKPL